MGQRCNLCWAIVVILHWANGNLLIGPSSHQHVGSMLGQCGHLVGPTLGHCRQLTLGQQHIFFVGPSSYKHVGPMVGQCQNMLGHCRHLTLGQQHNFCVGPSSYKHVGTMMGQCQNMLGYCRHLTLGQQHNFCVGPSSYKHVATLVGQSQNMLGYSTFTLAQCKNSLGLRWAAVGIQHRVNDDFFVGSLSCMHLR